MCVCVRERGGGVKGIRSKAREENGREKGEIGNRGNLCSASSAPSLILSSIHPPSHPSTHLTPTPPITHLAVLQVPWRVHLHHEPQPLLPVVALAALQKGPLEGLKVGAQVVHHAQQALHQLAVDRLALALALDQDQQALDGVALDLRKGRRRRKRRGVEVGEGEGGKSVREDGEVEKRECKSLVLVAIPEASKLWAFSGALVRIWLSDLEPDPDRWRTSGRSARCLPRSWRPMSKSDRAVVLEKT
jgi:hypothetical protein